MNFNALFRPLTLIAAAAGLVWLLTAFAAKAELGASANTIESDRIRFNGSRVVSVGPVVTVHQLRLADGSSVIEYTNVAGVVFAVSWRTRLKPNLRVLLGAQYELAATPAAAPTGIAGARAHRSIRNPNFVLHETGRTNAFGGLAYVPTLVPQGVDADALR
jgi:hypothetical protein